MIKVGGVPLLTHIMRIFKSYGHNDFLIAAGYKKNIIEWETKGIYSTTPSQSGTEREWTPMRWKGH